MYGYDEANDYGELNKEAHKWNDEREKWVEQKKAEYKENNDNRQKDFDKIQELEPELEKQSKDFFGKGISISSKDVGDIKGKIGEFAGKAKRNAEKGIPPTSR